MKRPHGYENIAKKVNNSHGKFFGNSKLQDFPHL